MANGQGNAGTKETTMTYDELDKEIGRRENELEPGSHTGIYGDFVTDMEKGGGDDWRESDNPVPPDVEAWWLRCYDLYEADQTLPADQQADDVQSIYDRV